MTAFRRILLLCFSFLAAVCSLAQVEVGGWRVHASFNNVQKVAQSADRVFGVSDGSLFLFDKKDYEVETLSKVEGLNGANVALVTYAEKAKALVIAYTDGNIDLLYDDGSIKNVPDIKNSSVSADKNPSELVYDPSTGNVYIAGEIGIIVFNPTKKEISDTYIIGDGGTYLSVYSVALTPDSIYALTPDGLKSASKSEKMLVNSAMWKTTVLEIDDAKQVEYASGQLFILSSSNKLYSKEIDKAALTQLDDGVLGFSVSPDGNLIVGKSNSVAKISADGSVISMCDNIYSPSAIQDSKSSERIWVAAGWRGVVELNNWQPVQEIKPSGPASKDVFSLRYSDGRIFAMTGNPRCYSASDVSKPGAVMFFENEVWNSITRNEVYGATGKNFLSLCYMSIDPKDKTHYYVTSLRDGLYEFRNDILYKRYGPSNSTLQVASTVSEADDYITVCGVALDNNDRLWMINELSAASVKVMLEDGTWKQFSYPNITNPPFMDKVVVLSNNQKWFGKPHRTYSTGGLFILDENGNTSSVSGHKTKFISSVTDQDGNLKSLGSVYDITEDRNGDVWVACDNGVFVFSGVKDIFSNGYKVTRPKISRNDGTNYADYLLDGQMVRAIAVDGGNRKWIGTNASGVYLMSADGLTQIQHFTEDNSPLLSNQILSIAVNDETGEVFIATGGGLVSYRSDATESNSDLDEIRAFPNPVRPNFNGVVTITGLMDGAVVKITDAAGNIVCQTVANGGEATWNLRNVDGRSVASGVYAVMASEANGGKARGAGKILVIR